MADSTIEKEQVDPVRQGAAPALGLLERSVLVPPPWVYVISILIALVFFSADFVLPRGATAAIGYCLVPVIAAGAPRRGFLLLMTVMCSVLTAIGYFTEAPGAAWWMSLFDRSMVLGVLWLTFFLVKRRAAYIHALVDQTQALRNVTVELRRSNAELERFASVVAHDLRGPLNSVKLLAELLGQYAATEANADYNDCVSSIRTELTRMSGFIQSLLEYGRIGARGIRGEECDLSTVLSDVKQRLKADLDRCSARIDFDPLPVLRADSVLMTQLFQNLIENSVKYRGSEPPIIHISATRESGAWLFSLRDNGIGVRAEDHDRIFAPFSQTNQGQSPREGVGLGLATCKRIVEQHRGRIWLDSAAQRGANFMFTIPDRQPPASQSPTRLNVALNR